MVEPDGTSNLNTQFRKLEKQLQRFNEQFPAEYKIKFYMDQATKELEGEPDEQTKKSLQGIVQEGRYALRSLAEKNMDALLDAYEAIHRLRATLNLPFYKSLGVSAKQREIAQRKRGPKLPKRAVMLAMDHGCNTAEEVRNFLFNKEELEDEWGDIGIAPNDDNDGFEITDYSKKNGDGDYQTATLRSSRIPKIISELK